MRSDKKYFSRSKISETLLDFAKPVFDKLETDLCKETLESGLMLAVTVWNAIVLDKHNSANRCITELRIRATAGPDGFDNLIDKLIERKQKYFLDDMRMITNEKVRWEGGQWIVSAEARV